MATDELTEEGKKILEDCFKQFDHTGEGFLNRDELAKALRFAGINPEESSVEEIGNLFDRNHDGHIQISELVQSWHELVQHSVNGEELLSAFKTLDRNGDGFIRLPELHKILVKVNKWTPSEAAQLLEDLMKFDANNDGKFDYPEFVNMFRSNSYPFVKPIITKKELPEKEDITQMFGKVSNVNPIAKEPEKVTELAERQTTSGETEPNEQAESTEIPNPTD